MICNIHPRGMPIDDAAARLAALAAAMIEQRTQRRDARPRAPRRGRRARLPRAAGAAEAGRAGRRVILEPIIPTVLSVRRLPHADPALVRAYGGDPARHTSLGLVTVDQDDPTYVALDEATKHAPVDVIFAKSFYAGAAHASGRLSGEILGVIGAAEPESIDARPRRAARAASSTTRASTTPTASARSPCSRT